MTWRHECIDALLWALGRRDKLDFPDAQTDTDANVALIQTEGGPALTAGARLRPVADILDALDLHYRLHWRARQSEQEGVEVTEFLPDVVMERHRVLNWLVQYAEADWDDVPTPT